MKRIFIILFLLNYTISADDKIFNEYLSKQQYFYRNQDNNILFDTIELFNKELIIPEYVLQHIQSFYFGIKINNPELYNNMLFIIRNDISKINEIFNYIEQFNIEVYSKYWDDFEYYDDRFLVFYYASGNEKYINKIMTIIQNFYYEKYDVYRYFSGRKALSWLYLLKYFHYEILEIYNKSNILSQDIKHYIETTSYQEIEDDTKLLFNKLFADENLNIFQHNAIKYNSDYFHEDDEFTILGTVESKGKNIVLANNLCIWGESRRATWRFLLFLNDGTFLGFYSGIIYNKNEIIIERQKIYFPFEAEDGNVIDFSKGIPKEIWIDGNIISYIKINDL